MGRYSNHLAPAWSRLLEPDWVHLEPTGNSRAQRQLQRRLNPHEVSELGARYMAGATVKELASRFGIHRTTVRSHLDRLGSPPRPRGLREPQVQDAVDLYVSGLSLAKIGDQLGCDAETARQALLRAGVTIRPRRGRA
jgi:DNA-directed RNA polymerase specialized sigma24 family protein